MLFKATASSNYASPCRLGEHVTVVAHSTLLLGTVDRRKESA